MTTAPRTRTNGDVPSQGGETRPATVDNTVNAYSAIRRGIVEGRYRPGERLIETRLADELSCSRTPIREALRMLDSDGLVETSPNRGATVRQLSTTDIRDLYEVRARLESLAAELAASRATPEQVQSLAAAESAFSRAVDAVNHRDLTSLRLILQRNDEFHRALLEAAHNERLRHALSKTVDHPMVFQAFRHYDAQAMQRSALFHRLIIEAIRSGDSSRAGRLVHEHILQGRDQLLEVVGDSDTIDALFR